MGSVIKAKKLRIGGMSCINCQNKIEKKLIAIGVKRAEVSYIAGTAEITYDSGAVSIKAITGAIQRLGYEVLSAGGRGTQGVTRAAGLLIIIAAIYAILEWFGLLNLLVPGGLAETGMGYGMLFVIGLVTSVHCVAMCGGINLSQCIPQGQGSGEQDRFSALRPAFLYNLGRLISYTAIGLIVGALGSVFIFSAAAQGALKLAAGLFMIIMGINMLGIFPWLRRLTLRMPKIFAGKIDAEKSRGNRPLIVGLLNGLMPCGPLQAMQLYALSTGNALAGGLAMLLFCLGTLPLMFGFGALSSILSRKFARKIMAAGAVLVAALGLSMFSQGLSLSSVSVGSGRPDAAADSTGAAAEGGVQIINSTLSPGKYPAITVEAGTPVKWIIGAPRGSINGCNNRIFINEYDIEYSFVTGENIIEFTPDETGTFQYSCWMGMIRGSIKVV